MNEPPDYPQGTLAHSFQAWNAFWRELWRGLEGTLLIPLLDMLTRVIQWAIDLERRMMRLPWWKRWAFKRRFHL